MKIANQNIGPGYPPYIIAEIGANHCGSVKTACDMVIAAKEIGASCVKIQCYTADSICAKEALGIEGGLWGGRDLYELYKQAQTPPNMAKEIIQFAQKHKITCFSSVFDFEGVDLMMKLGSPAIKIASFELVDLPLIARASQTGLPVIISTGMGTMEEIKDAVNCYHRHAKRGQEENLALLHCVSEYPASAREANLPILGPLSTILGGHHVVGLSDHTLGVGVAAASVALGAAIIEKHLVLDRSRGGVDAAFSSEPAEFSAMIKACREAYAACLPFPVPQSSYRHLRKSLYTVETIPAGTVLSTANVRPLRPARGLSPKLYQSILGKVATRELPAGTALQSDMFGDCDGTD